MAKKEFAITPINPPLAQSLQTVSEFMEYLEEVSDGEIPDDLIPEFDAAGANLQAAVDRRVFLIDSLDVTIEHLDKIITNIKLKMQKLENVKKKIFRNTLDNMRLNNIREIHGSFKSFKIRNKGGVEAINWIVSFQKLDNVISETELSMIPAEFLEEKRVMVVNKKALSDAIRKADYNDGFICGSKAGREEVLAIV